MFFKHFYSWLGVIIRHVLHSVNSFFGHTVDRIPLVAPYLYGLCCPAIFMVALDCDMTLVEGVRDKEERLFDHI